MGFSGSAVDPGSPDALTNLGEYLEASGEEELAVRSFMSAVKVGRAPQHQHRHHLARMMEDDDAKGKIIRR
jgi:hypothetical protein